MKSVVYLLLIVVTLGFGSCSNHRADLQLDGTLEAEVVKLDTAIYGSSIRCGYKDLVFLWQKSPDWCFEVCQLKNDSLIKLGNFLSKGGGPFEMPRGNLYVSEDLQKLFVWSDNYVTMYSIPFPLYTNIFQQDTWTKLNVPSPEGEFFWSNSLSPIQAVDDSTFLVMASNYKENYFLSLVGEGNCITPVYDLPYPEDGVSAAPIIRWSAYNNDGWFLKRPGYNKYAFTGEDGNYLGIFDWEDKKICNLKYSLNEFPDYYARPDGINIKRNPNNQLGYMAKATSKYIYLLASPFKKRQERVDNEFYKGYNRFSRNRITICTWEGEIVGNYLLEIPINSFVVSEDDRFLIGYTEDPETGDYMMVRYALPID